MSNQQGYSIGIMVTLAPHLSSDGATLIAILYMIAIMLDKKRNK